MKGCFQVARQIFNSPIWRDNPHILKLFIYLVGKARFLKEPKKFPHFTVNRGELVTSLADISEDNEYLERGRPKKWSRAKVSRMLEHLAKNDYITLLPDTYGTHIKIVNYDTYQTLDTYKADSSETQPDASETQVSIYKNVKNGKNDKNEEKTIVEQEPRQRIPHAEIISFLNQQAETNFKHTTKATIGFIRARWREGFRLDDFKAVISHKCEEWKGDEKMGSFLRPQTLFGTKFESYRQAAGVQPEFEYKEWVDVTTTTNLRN